jgi:Phosphoribosyl-dephospho-CoA transferase MdcG
MTMASSSTPCTKKLRHGSVGFELATGCRTVTRSSDLDLVLHADDPFSARGG